MVPSFGAKRKASQVARRASPKRPQAWRPMATNGDLM